MVTASISWTDRSTYLMVTASISWTDRFSSRHETRPLIIKIFFINMYCIYGCKNLNTQCTFTLQSESMWMILQLQAFYYSSYYNRQNHLNTSLNVWHWEQKTNQQKVSIRTLKYLCAIIVQCPVWTSRPVALQTFWLLASIDVWNSHQHLWCPDVEDSGLPVYHWQRLCPLFSHITTPASAD